jgi:hypothetical protein
VKTQNPKPKTQNSRLETINKFSFLNKYPVMLSSVNTGEDIFEY